MNAKQYLYSIRDEQKEIEELKDRIFELEMSLYPKGIRYDKDKVQTSPQDRMSETMAISVDYQKMLQDKLHNLIDRRKEAQLLIDRLQKSYERQILDIYFLSMRKVHLDDVASMIGFSRTQTYRYYKSALKHLDELRLKGIE